MPDCDRPTHPLEKASQGDTIMDNRPASSSQQRLRDCLQSLMQSQTEHVLGCARPGVLQHMQRANLLSLV